MTKCISMLKKIISGRFALRKYSLILSLMFIFSNCLLSTDTNDNILVWLSTWENPMQGSAHYLLPFTGPRGQGSVSWQVGSYKSEVKIMDVDCGGTFYPSSSTEVQVEFNETPSTNAFTVYAVFKIAASPHLISPLVYWYYVDSIMVIPFGGRQDMKFDNLGNVPWTRVFNLHDIGVSKAPIDTNLHITWNKGKGDSSNLKLGISERDLIQDLQGVWFTDNEPHIPLFIDVMPYEYDGPGQFKLSLVPGATSKDWGPLTSLTYYGVPPGHLIHSGLIRYNMLPRDPQVFMDSGSSITYEIGRLGNGPLTLLQGTCGGFPAAAKGDPKQAASIKWWQDAKTLTKAKYLKMPDDVASITGLYYIEGEGGDVKKYVYVGYNEPTDASEGNIIFIPNVSVPLPEPPAYPEWGNIVPIKCYGVKSGYVITGSQNRWGGAINSPSVPKFSYHITEDLNGNTILIQDGGDFRWLPSKPKFLSQLWWNSMRVLIKMPAQE